MIFPLPVCVLWSSGATHTQPFFFGVLWSQEWESRGGGDFFGHMYLCFDFHILHSCTSWGCWYIREIVAVNAELFYNSLEPTDRHGNSACASNLSLDLSVVLIKKDKAKTTIIITEPPPPDVKETGAHIIFGNDYNRNGWNAVGYAEMNACTRTCVCTGEGAEYTGKLSGSVVNLHNVVQSGLEEGELAEDHCRRHKAHFFFKSRHFLVSEIVAVTYLVHETALQS